MKRIVISILAGGCLLVTAIMATAATVRVQDTKHNLSSTGTGSIKSLAAGSGGTTEICVFCHTPHSASLEAPLWNRSMPVGSYQTYTSDILSALGYGIEDPLNASAAGYAIHVKTRVCMSCHDGTIALGNLRNLPTGMNAAIQMSGTSGGKIGTSSPGYLGIDIRDDHPVSMTYDTTKDPELQAISGSNVRLYKLSGSQVIVDSARANGSYVECTTCHNPHDNQYGNFLIDTNQFSKICVSCHTKTGYSSGNANESVHSNTTYSTAYAPPSGAQDAGNPLTLGGSVQTVKCMACHFTHKTGLNAYPPATPNPVSGKYLLTYQEEATCFNNTNRWGQTSVQACHGLSTPNLAGSPKNLQSVTGGGIENTAGSAYAHRVGAYTQKHSALEGNGGWNWSAGGLMHVECDDCHNSHSAGRLLHSKGTNTVTSVLTVYGSGGVDVPSWPAGGWTATFLNSTYSYIQPLGAVSVGGGVSYEWQICLKCHSSFATGTPYPAGSWTDQAKEFNTSNASYHSVVQLNPSRYTPTQWTASGFNNSSLMYCSDCHSTNQAAPQPQGTHGSGNSGLLFAPANMTYGIPTASGGTAQQNSDLCLQCHAPAVYNNNTVSAPTTSMSGFRLSGGTTLDLHGRHAFQQGPSGTSAIPNIRAYRCANCHTRASHGWKRQGLVVFRGDGVGESWPNAYEAEGANTGLIDSTATLPSSATYGAAVNANCTTSNTFGCHQ